MIVAISKFSGSTSMINALGTTESPFTTITLILVGPGASNGYTDQSDANGIWSAHWDGSYTEGDQYNLIVTATDGSASDTCKIA